MTNPSNIVRIHSRNGGRASVYEANMWAQAHTAGLFNGDGVVQNVVPDMNVLVGGTPSDPDIVLATLPSGYQIALDIIGQQAVPITAPASNSRISSIIAYTDDVSLLSSEDTITGSPATCGLIVVNGTAGANPNPPSDSTIRSAITSDGATGSQAAYGIVAEITVASSTTSITNTLINVLKSRINISRLNGGSTAGVLTTDASGNVSVGAKTVDANGWDVYPKGDHTVYRKQFVIPSQTIGSGGGLLTITGNNLPVGMATIGNAHIQFTLRLGTGSPFLVANFDGGTAATNLQIGVSRTTGSATYAGAIYVEMVA